MTTVRAEAGVLRALVVGAVVSLGFAALFGVAGRHHQLDLVRHRALRLMGHDRDRHRARRARRGVHPRVGSRGSACPASTRAAGTGACGRCSCSVSSYAIASLSCAIGPFMTAVAGTFRRSNLVSGMVVFGAYALGMAVLLMALTLTLALARQSLLRGLRASLPYIQRISGVIMVDHRRLPHLVRHLRDPGAGRHRSAPAARSTRSSAGQAICRTG